MMLSKLCVWYLRMRKRSVIINCYIEKGDVRTLSGKAYVYDNVFMNSFLYNKEGEHEPLPDEILITETSDKKCL